MSFTTFYYYIRYNIYQKLGLKMYKSRPGLDLLRYMIFSLCQRIPKVIRVIILLIVEFVIVYKIYYYVDHSFTGISEQKGYDGSKNSVNDLPIQYRRYYKHYKGD